jgi:hypothetical protein
MKRFSILSVIVSTVVLLLSSCSIEDRYTDLPEQNQETNTVFNIFIAKNTRTKTKSTDDKETKSENGTRSENDTRTVYEYDAARRNVFLDSDIAFGLVGVDNERTEEVLVDNEPIYEQEGVRTATLTTSLSSSGSMKVSAYYPYVSSVNYHKDGSYAISFTPNDIKQGPLASNVVYMRCDQEHETVNLQFHHISNCIGFKVCDITEDEQLKELMHVRKVVLHGMPTEGMYVVDGADRHWVPNAKHQQIVVYEGDDLVKSGIENAAFMGETSLSDNHDDCHRFYVVPEELKEGKHYVEVIFDVESFDYDGTHYRGVTGKSQIIPLSGVIPDDMMELGLQYTFVLGMNICTVYRPIEFTATVENWEAKFNGHIMDYDNE